MNEALRKAGEDWEKEEREKISLAQLMGKVASYFDLEESSIIVTKCQRPAFHIPLT